MKYQSEYIGGAWEKDKIPSSYAKVDWQMRQERIPSDYGVPEKPYMPEYQITDWEGSTEHDEAIIF